MLIGKIGYVQLINIQPAPRSAELGILIGDPGDRGQGFGQEALRLALDFSWRDLNLERVALFVIGDNAPALPAHARAGFEVEGVLRRSAYVDGAHHAVTVMGILRQDDRPARPAEAVAARLDPRPA